MTNLVPNLVINTMLVCALKDQTISVVIVMSLTQDWCCKRQFGRCEITTLPYYVGLVGCCTYFFSNTWHKIQSFKPKTQAGQSLFVLITVLNHHIPSDHFWMMLLIQPFVCTSCPLCSKSDPTLDIRYNKLPGIMHGEQSVH